MSDSPRRLLYVFGTRPEAIKLAPLILATQARPDLFTTRVCVTAQHRRMLDQVLALFGIVPDVDLDVMTPGQTLASLSARVLERLDPVLEAEKPDLVIVQGDTTTVLIAALASFYRRIAVAHVEAGLRTGNKLAPFPEEINRVLTTRLADIHFAPTQRSADNLLRDGVAADAIHVTGNTVIDALLVTVERVKKNPPPIPGLSDADLNNPIGIVAITGHRRENFGTGFENICQAIATLSERFPGHLFVYPVHLNPNVLTPVRAHLGSKPNVRLIEPLDYAPFVRLMTHATLLLTDSGGVQEEAPSLGKPVLVMRETTERPEAVDAGTVELVGANADRIIEGVSRLLSDRAAYDRMARAHNPYGDGRACERIVAVLHGKSPAL